MPEYLSQQWIDQLDQALSSSDDLCAAVAAGQDITVAYRVDDVSYHVQLGPSGVGAAAGSPDQPTVTFVQTRATAQPIANGSLSSEQAFITGLVRFEGDVQALLGHQQAVAKVGDLTAGLRATG